MSVADAKVLVVGVGGLGCPAAIALAAAGVGAIGLVDDDRVDLTNLHRQILYTDADVGRPKAHAAARALAAFGPNVALTVHETRLLPENAAELVQAYDLVVEGSDNFATKFLAADAARLARRPIVHGAALRWQGTAFAVGPSGGPCYRCLFEDLPEGDPPNCDQAGVVGPVVGVVAAIQADLALAVLDGDASVLGELVRFDGKTLDLRRHRLGRRADCVLCGDGARIDDIRRDRYLAPSCRAV